ncbi:MAG: enoyl-CoA hydratase/isomerase family protein [Acidobacteriota bacterium]|nr:MAG: enoyl-CoA hydratase/isomerase family protein [Acidobacteriota bacterium]
MTESPPILFEEEGRVATITLNRPRRMNCLTREAIFELSACLDRLQESRATSVLIITGAGGLFSAGADLSEISSLDPSTAYDFSRLGQKILSSIGEAAPVTIAAIDGYCLGGGLDVALSCDLRYATPRSSFQHPGTKRGIITGWGGTQRLPRLIGRDAARRMLVAGDRIGAGEALGIGLINGIEEDPLEFARGLAATITSRYSRDELPAIRNSLDAETGYRRD